MKIKSTTPNKNQFAKFEITLDKKDFDSIVYMAVDAYICNECDSDLYNEKAIINAVSKCEVFKEKVISETLLELQAVLRQNFFEKEGLGKPWEESPICQKIEEDIRSKRYKKEESREIKDAKRLLEKSGFKVLKG